MIEIKLNENVSVQVWPEKQFLQSVFKSGGTLPAAPNWQHEPSVRLAHELGYKGDCFAMSRDHEILHHVSAIHSGAPWSWTLWWEAHKALFSLPRPPRGLYSREEAVTLGLQAFLHGGDWRHGRNLAAVPNLDRLVAQARSTLLPLEEMADAA